VAKPKTGGGEGSRAGLGLFLMILAGAGYLTLLGLSGDIARVVRFVAEVVAIVEAVARALVWFVPAVLVLVLVLVLMWRRCLPVRSTRVLRAMLGVDGKGVPRRERPRLRWAWKRGPVWTVAWRMPVGPTIAYLLQHKDVLEEQIDASVNFWFNRGLVWMEAGAAPLPKEVKFSEFERRAPKKVRTMALPIPIGPSRIGDLWIDLARLPHLLGGGTTNYGKTTWLRQVITSLARRYGPERLGFLLIDFKRIEFNSFAKLRHLVAPVVTELEDAEISLGWQLAEMKRRQDLFAAAGVDSIASYNGKNADHPLRYVVIVVDEIAELRPKDAQGKEEQAQRSKVLAQLQRFGRLGRAFGFHVMAFTQRPDAETVGGQLKAQLPGTVAFYCRDATNSKILLDDAAAASLPPWPGRGIWQFDKQVQFQGPVLEKAECEQLLAAAFEDGPAARDVVDLVAVQDEKEAA
jgi:S-DNA-T family DNA segregation ATPase FtsK/SpoIIIE